VARERAIGEWQKDEKRLIGEREALNFVRTNKRRKKAALPPRSSASCAILLRCFLIAMVSL
jgi:hypothetical protein